MLKKKSGVTPFYADVWFWVKVMVFVIFVLFLIWPFSSMITNAFHSSKAEGFTWYNFNRLKRSYSAFLFQHESTSSVSAR